MSNNLGKNQKFVTANINASAKDSAKRPHASGSWWNGNSSITLYQSTYYGVFDDSIHEFGHIFGLGDAYTEEDEDYAVCGVERMVPTKETPVEMVMNAENIVTPNDIEMIMIAAVKKEWQHYKNYSYRDGNSKVNIKKSEAIRIEG